MYCFRLASGSKSSCTYCNSGETVRSWFYLRCFDGVALVASWQEDWVYVAAIYAYNIALFGAGVSLWIGCAVCATDNSKVSRIEHTNGITRETWEIWILNFVRASANLWNSLRGERAAWLKNSLIVENFKRNLKCPSSVNGSWVL